MKNNQRLKKIFSLLLALALAGMVAGTAQAFEKEITVCKGNDEYVYGLDPSKEVHIRANCASDQKVVNWQTNIWNNDRRQTYGNGFECSMYPNWTYRNTYQNAEELEFYGQGGCVKIRITQE